MKWIELDNYAPTRSPEFDTNSNTINPDAASARRLDGGRRGRGRRPGAQHARVVQLARARTRASSTPPATAWRRRRCASTPTSPRPTASTRPCPGFAPVLRHQRGGAERRRDRGAAALGEPAGDRERDLRPDERARERDRVHRARPSSPIPTAARASSSPTSPPPRLDRTGRGRRRRRQSPRSQPVRRAGTRANVIVDFSVTDPESPIESRLPRRAGDHRRHADVQLQRAQRRRARDRHGDHQARHQEAQEAEDQGDQEAGRAAAEEEDQVQVEATRPRASTSARSRATARSPASTSSRRRPPTRPG